MAELTSRERMLRALRHQPCDYVPCCFMSFTALRRRCQENLYELLQAERAMGLDSFLFIPTTPRPQRPDHPDLRGLPVRFHPAVEIREWREDVPGDFPVLHKVYATPAGKLQTSVRLSDDWPHGDHLPFVDDYQVPRALKPLITQPGELAALRYLLTPPTADDIEQFKRDAQKARDFAAGHGVLLAAGWGVGADLANWLCGFQNLMVFAHESLAFITELLEIVHDWNLQRMRVVLSARPDLFIRRAWYEGCDFVTPGLYREVILPRLKTEVALAHERGALFGYICTSGISPMLDFYTEAGIDVLIGIDPVQGTHSNLDLIKKKLRGRISVWGGVSGAVTVETGTEEDVRWAVREAFRALGPHGFILSPVDNITVDSPKTWQNIEVFIDEWRRARASLNGSAAS